MESIFNAFPGILDQFDTNAEAREAFVFAAWRQSMGEVLSEHTAPLKLVDDRLRVAVSNLTWKRHLEAMAPEILAKLNARLGRSTVVFIEFFVDQTVGEIQMVRGKRSKATATATTHDGWRELRESAEAISNEALKEKFMLAAAGCLERKERMKKRGR